MRSLSSWSFIDCACVFRRQPLLACCCLICTSPKRYAESIRDLWWVGWWNAIMLRRCRSTIHRYDVVSNITSSHMGASCRVWGAPDDPVVTCRLNASYCVRLLMAVFRIFNPTALSLGLLRLWDWLSFLLHWKWSWILSCLQPEPQPPVPLATEAHGNQMRSGLILNFANLMSHFFHPGFLG